jgi:hypothetical protein
MQQGEAFYSIEQNGSRIAPNNRPGDAKKLEEIDKKGKAW